MTSDTNRPSEAARCLSNAQKLCGDVLDSFPCVHCGAKGIKGCSLPEGDGRMAADLINQTPGLLDHLHRAERIARALKEGMNP